MWPQSIMGLWCAREKFSSQNNKCWSATMPMLNKYLKQWLHESRLVFQSITKRSRIMNRWFNTFRYLSGSIWIDLTYLYNKMDSKALATISENVCGKSMAATMIAQQNATKSGNERNKRKTANQQM